MINLCGAIWLILCWILINSLIEFCGDIKLTTILPMRFRRQMLTRRRFWGSLQRYHDETTHRLAEQSRLHHYFRHVLMRFKSHSSRSDAFLLSMIACVTSDDQFTPLVAAMFANDYLKFLVARLMGHFDNGNKVNIYCRWGCHLRQGMLSHCL